MYSYAIVVYIHSNVAKDCLQPIGLLEVEMYLFSLTISLQKTGSYHKSTVYSSGHHNFKKDVAALERVQCRKGQLK